MRQIVLARKEATKAGSWEVLLRCAFTVSETNIRSLAIIANENENARGQLAPRARGVSLAPDFRSRSR